MRDPSKKDRYECYCGAGREKGPHHTRVCENYRKGGKVPNDVHIGNDREVPLLPDGTDPYGLRGWG